MKMKQMNYLISDASKLVEVESHVLRYWEEELGIPIKRNELGHRYYTQEDIERFREIKNLKEQGLQLKAIRMILKNGKLENITGTGEEKRIQMIEIVGERELSETKPAARTETGTGLGTEMARTETAMEMKLDWQDSREEKSRRLQLLLQHMISEAVRENNRELYEELRDCILKEMDYQFRQQEEREEERENGRKKREEDHYLRIDELLRDKGRKKEKTGAFWSRKKPSAV